MFAVEIVSFTIWGAVAPLAALDAAHRLPAATQQRRVCAGP